MMSNDKRRIEALEHQVENLKKAREEDRTAMLNIADQIQKTLSAFNERLNQHYDDFTELSDRLNLAEGMIEIIKSDLDEVHQWMFKEEDLELDEHETS